MKIKPFVLIFYSLLFFNLTKGQDGVGGGGSASEIYLGDAYKVNVIPPPPEAASLGKYGNVPVNEATGIPQISIPLYTVNLRDFELGINLSYHAGGNKVDDIGSSVGLGWSLLAGGVITQTVKDESDLELWSQPRQETITDLTELDFDDNITSENQALYNQAKILTGPLDQNDTEPDLFSYNFGRFTGTLVFTANGVGSGLPVSLNHVELSIDYTEAAGPANSVFTIMDEKGNTYIFSDVEESTYDSNRDNDRYVDRVVKSYSWYLTQITTYLGETIDFVYEQHNYSYSETQQELIGIADGSNCNNCPDVESYNIGETWVPTRDVDGLFIDYIETKNTKVDFTYSSLGREDLTGYPVLDSIKIKKNINGVESVVTSFNLGQTYFAVGGGGPGYGRLKLSSVEETGKPAYTFTYNEDVNLPGRGSMSQDWWGYYNDNTANTLIEYSGADRSSNLTKVKANILTEINYPTGGKTFFEYDANTLNGGGLRVSQVTDYPDSSTEINVKTYSYSNGVGAASLEEYSETHAYAENSSGFLETCSYKIYSSHPGKMFNRLGGNNVSYRTVSIDYGPNGSKGKVVKTFNNPGNLFSYSSFTNTTLDYHDNILLQEVIYENDNPVKTVDYSYDLRVLENAVTGFTIKTIYPEFDASGTVNDKTQTFEVYNYAYYPLQKALMEKETIAQEGNGSHVTSEVNTYNFIRHTKPQKTIIESGNLSGSILNTITIDFKYPADYPSGVITPGYIRDYVVSKEVTYSNGDKTGLYHEFDYIDDDSTIVLPVKTYQTATINGTAHTKELIEKEYDTEGYITQYEGNDGVPVAVLWDENLDLPIAKAALAGYEEVAYTSFEYGSSHKWEIEGTHQFVRNGNGLPSGIYYLNLSNGNITCPVNSGEKFYLSFWSAGDGFTLLNADELGEPVIVENSNSGWAFRKYLVESNSTTIGISGTGKLDELRLYPESASMESYTYSSRGSRLSVTDANGMATYYAYDALGRLVTVKDQDFNMLEKFDYVYYDEVGGTNKYLVTGIVKNSNNEVLKDISVSLTYSGLVLETESNQEGAVYFFIPENTDFSVEVTEEGYEPNVVDYTGIQSNKNIDIAGDIISYAISGTIQDYHLASIEGVLIELSDGSASTTSASDGTYTLTVDYGSGGTLLISKYGYSFERVCANPGLCPDFEDNYITQDYSGINFEGTELSYVIGGVIDGFSGDATEVKITYSGLGDVYADFHGIFGMEVPYGWAGSVTPYHEGYNFSPVSESYSNVTSNQVTQHYTATIKTYLVSGYIKKGGVGVSGVSVAFSGLGSVSTNSSGYYSKYVDYGWSGTITPSKTGYNFSPASKSLSDVKSTKSSQNFTATLKTYTISGYIKDSGGNALSGATLSKSTGGTTTSSSSGYYSFTVDYGWSGSISVSKAGYTFSTSSKSYSSVSSNKSNQNFTGEVIMISIQGTVTDNNFGMPVVGAVVNDRLKDPDNAEYTATTDSYGNYTMLVPYGWSGSLYVGDGTSTTPLSYSYSNITQSVSNKDYVMDLMPPR